MSADTGEARFLEAVSGFCNLERTGASGYTSESYSLARMEPLAALAGHPERGLRILHVAGTKGKGSTSYFAGALLASAGIRAGVFTSPHVLSFCERIQVDGQPVSAEALLAQTEAFKAKLEAAGIPRPQLFEVLTIVALRLFADAGCTHAVLETGIGGTLDATNFVAAPAACAITAVSFDHQEILGGTIEEIAAQKAGIIKPGVPVVCGRQPFPAAAAVIRRRAAELGAPVLDPWPAAAASGWLEAAAPEFLKENFGLALRLCQAAGVEPRREQFRPPPLPGRFEVVDLSPPVVLDAAHNRDSAHRLREALATRWPGRRFHVVLGVVDGKDAEGILAELCPLAIDFILVELPTPRGSQHVRLAALADSAGVPWRPGPPPPASSLAAEAGLLFTGSFHTVALGKQWLAARTGPAVTAKAAAPPVRPS